MERFKKWLVKKLGGYYLDEEERALLFPLWVKRLNNAMLKQSDIQSAEILFNGFKTSYVEENPELLSNQP